jgi:hypothetical protein
MDQKGNIDLPPLELGRSFPGDKFFKNDFAQILIN